MAAALRTAGLRVVFSVFLTHQTLEVRALGLTGGGPPLSPGVTSPPVRGSG